MKRILVKTISIVCYKMLTEKGHREYLVDIKTLFICVQAKEMTKLTL